MSPRIGPVELVVICVILLFLVVLLAAGFFAVRFLAKRSPINQGLDQKNRVPCPNCAELILPDAKVCRYCGRDLEVR